MTRQSAPGDLSRRDLFRAGVGAALAAGALGAQSHAQKTKPNILFIMTDQQRGDCIGADGNSLIHTPNIDRIGREGARFKHAYTCTPSCTPARAALLSGLGPWRNGMLGYSRIPEQFPIEKPRALGEAGYFTTSIGKNHFHPQRNTHGYHQCILDESGRELDPEFRSDYRAWFKSVAPTLDPDATGLDWNGYTAAPYALPEELHPTHWTGETAVRFLKNYDREQPFYLKVSFARPHSPYDAPQRHFDRYKDAELPKAVVGDWAARYEERNSDDVTIWRGKLSDELIRHARQGYYGNITFIDEQIGRMLEALEQRGILEETLIVFTSDHGDMLGDHNLWRKSYAYEASARIPMLVRWPEGLISAKRGQVREEPVELRDICPTFLDAAGDSRKDDLEGKSMLPLMAGKAAGREYIDLEHDICYDKSNHWSALTDGKQKYIYHCLDGEEMLFDLELDPGETKNLAGDAAHEKTRKLWRSRLVDHLGERGEPFVKNGDLAPRPERYLHSPHYVQPA